MGSAAVSASMAEGRATAGGAGAAPRQPLARTDRGAEVDGTWSGEELDLDAYLARVGYRGAPSPTRETLHALHTGHVLSIPFENLEIILGRGIPLDLATVQDKLVHSRRGGYCYEHTTLFAAALERLGFRFTALSARVTLGAEKLLPATHALLRVSTAETPTTGEEWLCDVGFGSSPLVPIPLKDGAEVAAGSWQYRLTWGRVASGEDAWTLYERSSDGWLDRHTASVQPQHPIDYAVGNHYVATHPRSVFRSRPHAQRLYPDGLLALNGLTLTESRPGQTTKREHSLKPEEVPRTLADDFDIALPERDAQRLVEAAREHAERG